MYDTMINLFIPRTFDGSMAAVFAHLYADDKDGGVHIVRYKNDDELNNKVEELMRHITIADGFEAPQPEHRYVWIVGSRVNNMVHDELHWFAKYKPGREYLQIEKSSSLWFMNNYEPIQKGHSLDKIFFHISEQDKVWERIQRLYTMIDPDEFEHLVSYLLKTYPNADDITTEDYVLNLFLSHKERDL